PGTKAPWSSLCSAPLDAELQCPQRTKLRRSSVHRRRLEQIRAGANRARYRRHAAPPLSARVAGRFLQQAPWPPGDLGERQGWSLLPRAAAALATGTRQVHRDPEEVRSLPVEAHMLDNQTVNSLAGSI